MPDISVNGSLLNLDIAAGFDVQYRSSGKGQRDVRIENQPDVLIVLGSSLQEALTGGQERRKRAG